MNNSNKNSSLKKYIKNVITLETKKYEEEAMLSRIDSKIMHYSHPPLIELKKVTDPSTGGGPIEALILGVGATLLLILALWFIGETSNGSGIILDFINNLPVWMARIFVISCYTWAIITILQNLIEDHDFSNYLQKKCEEDMLFNRTAREKNNRIKAQYNNTLLKLKKDRAFFQTNLYNTQKALNSYYDLNIIHRNYRGLVPMTSIYQYLDTGICDTLEGHFGCYNTYNNELNMKTILGKIDDVLANLYQIKDCQKHLFSLLQQSNNTIGTLMNRISSENEKMVDAVNGVNGHLCTIEYTNKVNQINTEVIADLQMFEFLSKR